MKKVFIAMFIFLLVGPNIVWILLASDSENVTTENRVLAEKPDFTIANIEKFPAEYESYYNDHLAFKNKVVNLKSLMDYKLFHCIDSDKVILGKNNWLFYKGEEINESPIEDYKGNNIYTEKEKQKISKAVQNTGDYLSKKEIEFSVMICPNKEHIYSEYLPDSIKKTGNKSKADDLAAYLASNTTADIIYPLNELEEGKKYNQLYYKYDTHWNRLGGFIGAQSIRKLYQNTSDAISKYPVKTDNNGAVTDLALMVNLKEEFTDDKDFYVSNYKPDVTAELIERTEDDNLNVYHSNAEDERKVLVIRDSYSVAMMGYVVKDFQDVVFIHRDVFKAEDIEKYNPDIVIYQIVERATNSMKKMDRLFKAN